MADRTSAAIFGNIFEYLASLDDPGIKEQEMANWLWEMQREYDFSPYQMDCDEALVELGFAKQIPSPDYPDETIWVYKGELEFKEE